MAIGLVRSAPHSDPTKQQNASASETKPAAITHAAPAREAEPISRSLPEGTPHIDWRHSDLGTCNGYEGYTSTSNEGTPRLRPVHNGSSILLPIVGSDADVLDFPRRLPQQTALSVSTNLKPINRAVSTPVDSVLASSLLGNNKYKKSLELPASSRTPLANTGPYTTNLALSTNKPTVDSRSRMKADGAAAALRGMEGMHTDPKLNEEFGDGDSATGSAEKTGGSDGTAEGGRSRGYSGSGSTEQQAGAASVEAAPMTNPRSRKSSHMMQLFKNTSPEQKQGAQRDRQRTAEQKVKHVDTGGDNIKSLNSVKETARSSLESVGEENIESAQENVHIQPISEQHAPSEEVQQELSLRALADVSNDSKNESTSVKPSPLPEGLPTKPHQQQRVAEPTDDGEEEGTRDLEHVAPAIYYPHRAPSPDTIDHASEDATQGLGRRETFVTLSRPEVRSPRLELEDPLRGDRESGPLSSRASDSGVSSASDSEYTDTETTPKATPTGHRAFLGFRTRKGRKTDTVPVPAIELTPFKHQVGGHTILYKFHKNGVTKSLTNDENKFYEVVESAHPELLEFLTQ